MGGGAGEELQSPLRCLSLLEIVMLRMCKCGTISCHISAVLLFDGIFIDIQSALQYFNLS